MNTTMKSKTKTGKKQQNRTDIIRLEPPSGMTEVSALCHETTRLTITRDKAQLTLEGLLEELQSKFGPELEVMGAQIEGHVHRLHVWAVGNRKEAFSGRQSIQVAGCKLEFRKGTGKVKTEVDEETAVNLVLGLPPNYSEQKQKLVRVKYELDKGAVIEMAQTPEGAAFLQRFGLSVAVVEDFKFTPAREDLTTMPLVSDERTARVAAAA